MASFWPSIALRSVDLPTLARPTMATKPLRNDLLAISDSLARAALRREL